MLRETNVANPMDEVVSLGSDSDSSTIKTTSKYPSSFSHHRLTPQAEGDRVKLGHRPAPPLTLNNSLRPGITRSRSEELASVSEDESNKFEEDEIFGILDSDDDDDDHDEDFADDSSLEEDVYQQLKRKERTISPTKRRNIVLSGGENLSSSSDHISTKKLPSEQQNQRKRRIVRRRPSMMIKKSIDDLHELPGSACENDTSLVALMAGVKRTASRRSILRNESSPPSKNKTVQWATYYEGTKSNKVWCLVREFEKYPAQLRDDLWWTADDMDKRTDQDMDMAELVEKRYRKVLSNAYDACVQTCSCPAEQQDGQRMGMDFSAMATCSLARGLELEVFKKIRQVKMKHRAMVLDILGLYGGRDSDEGMSDADARRVRLQSLRLSEPLRLLALQMAEFDHREATC